MVKLTSIVLQHFPDFKHTSLLLFTKEVLIQISIMIFQDRICASGWHIFKSVVNIFAKIVQNYLIYRHGTKVNAVYAYAYFIHFKNVFYATGPKRIPASTDSCQ